jgi:hypothetical protein
MNPDPCPFANELARPDEPPAVKSARLRLQKTDSDRPTASVVYALA